MSLGEGNSSDFELDEEIATKNEEADFSLELPEASESDDEEGEVEEPPAKRSRADNFKSSRNKRRKKVTLIGINSRRYQSFLKRNANKPEEVLKAENIYGKIRQVFQMNEWCEGQKLQRLTSIRKDEGEYKWKLSESQRILYNRRKEELRKNKIEKETPEQREMRLKNRRMMMRTYMLKKIEVICVTISFQAILIEFFIFLILERNS